MKKENKNQKYFRIVHYKQHMSIRIGSDDEQRMTGVDTVDVDLSFKSIEDCHHVAQMAGVAAYTIITTDEEDRWSYSSRENEVFVSALLKSWREQLANSHKLGVESAHRVAKFLKTLPDEKVIFEDDSIQYVARKFVKGDTKDQLDRGYQPKLDYSCIIKVQKKAMFSKTSTDNSIGNASEYRQWRGSSRVNGKLVESHNIILGKKLCDAYRRRTEDTDAWVRGRGWREVPREANPELQKRLVRQFEFAYEAFLNFSRARHEEVNEAAKQA